MVSTECMQSVISVIVPAYNCDAFLRTALESVLSQDYPSIDVIIVDDGSTDDTARVAKEIASAEPDRVRVEHQRNAGSAAARNRGIELARGQYVAFLDADDLWLPGKLSLQERFLRSHPNIGLVCSRWELLNQGEACVVSHELYTRLINPTDINTDLFGWIYDTLFSDCVVWTSTVLMRKSVLEQVGHFDETLWRGQDYDFWLRAARVTEIARLNCTTALYRIHGSSVTRTPHKKNYEGIVIRKNALSRAERKRLNSSIGHLDIRKRFFGTWRNFWYEHHAAGQWRFCALASMQMVRWAPWRPSAWIAVARTLLVKL